MSYNLVKSLKTLKVLVRQGAIVESSHMHSTSLEVLRLGVDARPHEVVVVVGGVHLVEAVRVADLRDQLRVRVHGLEAQPEIWSRRRGS